MAGYIKVILGAVVCAIVAFCALPGSIINADAKTEIVEYVDREWKDGKIVETQKSQECTVLTKKICKNGLNDGWYVLNDNIKYTKDPNIKIQGEVKLILKDNCIIKTGYRHGSIDVTADSMLTIFGQSQGSGKIDFDGRGGKAGIRVSEEATLNIKGGIIKSEGTTGGAGIGGNKRESAGNLNIYGGTITVNGGKNGAGIGGGEFGAHDDFYDGWGGQTNIYGGTVTANGGSGAAGIGGGKGANLFSNTYVGGGGGYTGIYGGTVTANGGYGAAGIGGGEGADGGNGGQTNIYGGIVTANGGGSAAGIGGGKARGVIGSDEGGYGGSEGATSIYGGIVTANGGSGAAGIGKGCSVGVRDSSWEFWDYIEIFGGTVTANGGYGAAGIDDCVIVGGNIKGENIKGTDFNGTDLPKRTITLDGVTEEDEVVGVNCNYGVNDVKTLDTDKLYFYMSEDEYEKLTEITVKDKTGKEDKYYKTEDLNVFSKKKSVKITGVAAQDGIYNGLPQQGYTRMPKNEDGYTGEYEITYCYLNGDKYEITTPENSGAAGEGKAPAYTGNYKVRISVPSSNYELEFNIGKVIPYVEKKPIVRTDDGTSLNNVIIEGGKVTIGDEEISGEWEAIDSILQSNPPRYLLKFTPTDERNYECKMVSVVSEVIETPTVAAPIVSASFNKNNREKLIEKLIEKLKEKVSEPEFKDKFSNPEFRNKVKDDIKNSTLIKDSTKKEILKKLLSNNPELKDKAIDKITNTEFIKDESVRAKLLSFIEE